MLGRVGIQHHLYERALQPRELSAHDNEAGTGHFTGALEVEHVERFTKLDMVPRLEFKLGRLAPVSQQCIVRLVPTVRNIVLQKIRQTEFNGLQLCKQRLQLCLTGRELVTQVLHCGQQWLYVLTLRFCPADGLGTRISLAAQFLGGNLQGLATFFQRQVGIGVKVKATARQVAGNRCRRMPE